MSSTVEIGIIGGSGLYDMAELTDREEQTVSTPFGDPSGPYVIGTLRGKRVAFLARHGAGHRLLPSELNFRANIYGMKVLGSSASCRERGRQPENGIPAVDIVVPDQFFDRTRGRVSTFFGNGIVGTSRSAPAVPRSLEDCRRFGAEDCAPHRGGTYVNMEGSRSPRSRSRSVPARGDGRIG
jgi:5'-methylthioadenosine phosphorylase